MRVASAIFFSPKTRNLSIYIKRQIGTKFVRVARGKVNVWLDSKHSNLSAFPLVITGYFDIKSRGGSMSDDKPFRVEYMMPETGERILHIYVRADNLALAKHAVDRLPYFMWEVKSVKKDTEENYLA